MTVDFNKNMIIPANYTYFDKDVLRIQILPNELSDIDKLGFNW
jgi:hypothetical protein